MAKKKSESSEKAPAKKSPAKKAIAKKQSASTSQPLVDTTLAAQNVARMMAAGLPHKTATAPSMGSNKTESTMFKNLKQGLSKPHLSGLDSLLDKGAPAENRKSNQPFGAAKQVGHNQTFGADVNRAGVPRRTPG